MNKGELIAAVAANAGTTKTDSEKIVNAFFTTVTSALSKGDKVTIPGFGSFQVTERAARKGRNPQTGAEINIPASKAPRFSAGKTLKDSIK